MSIIGYDGGPEVDIQLRRGPAASSMIDIGYLEVPEDAPDAPIEDAGETLDKELERMYRMLDEWNTANTVVPMPRELTDAEDREVQICRMTPAMIRMRDRG